jgi:putative CocE/NonD family hydrolase
MWGVRDQRPVEERSDVLVYTTAPFPHDVEAAGPVTVHLFAASDARDTDWTAKVVDVSPSGYAMNLTDAILRARYHRSFEHPELLTPGEVYEFTINVGYTDNVFLKGHCLRLEISSSSFPAFSRNTNTGNQPEKDTQFKVAHQTIYHGPARASYLELHMRESKAEN